MKKAEGVLPESYAHPPSDPPDPYRTKDTKDPIYIRRARYVDAFLNSKCASTLVLHQLFPNAKEITESWSMFDATRHLGPEFAWSSPDVLVACVGDGRTPRTAAMFAFRTQWQAHSIDPDLQPSTLPIERLTQHRARVADVSLEHDGPVLIVACHSHARLADTLAAINGRTRSLIAMPCCFEHDVPGRRPDYEYQDPYVWSPKNLVKIWRTV